MPFGFDPFPIVAVVAPTCSYLMYASPLPTLFTLAKQRRSDNVSPVPYLVHCLSAVTWLQHAILRADNTLTYLNLIGTFLYAIYAVIYAFLLVERKNKIALAQKSTVFVVTCSLIWWHVASIDSGGDRKAAIDRIGLIAAGINIMSIASPLIGLKEAMRIQSTENLPFPLIFMGFMVSTQWFYYAYRTNDVHRMVAKGINSCISSFTLSLFLRYPRKSAQKTE